LLSATELDGIFVMDLDGGDEVVIEFGNSEGYYLQVLGAGGGGSLVLEPSVALGTVKLEMNQRLARTAAGQRRLALVLAAALVAVASAE
jgi:hypothetical protein